MEKFSIDPLEKSPAKQFGSIFLIFLLGVILTTGTIRVILWLPTILTGLLSLANLYSRLGNLWGRIHYPIMVRYSTSLGMTRGMMENGNLQTDDPSAYAVGLVLRSVFPNASEKEMDKIIEGVTEVRAKFGTKSYLKKMLENSSTADKTKIDSSLDELSELITNPKTQEASNSYKIKSAIAYLVGLKYGDKEQMDYLFNSMTGKAI